MKKIVVIFAILLTMSCTFGQAQNDRIDNLFKNVGKDTTEVSLTKINEILDNSSNKSQCYGAIVEAIFIDDVKKACK